MKGALAHAVFDLKRPNIKKEVDDFFSEVEQARQKKGIPLVSAIKRKVGETKMEVAVFPATNVPPAEELQQQGFTVAGAGDLTSVRTSFKEFDFTQTVTFPPKK